ncbi:odorant receptor 131-2-like [Pseudochaenichthys georgianus]|uniref:odorant receptor 131-2-like n=1 Tax=Pseudochaenichthys georgianus TaxID=52239 RepID=UPI00146A1204|nr:odorant receptor 131-2-like [Pseudochaenichthys georgianus]
MSLGNQYLTNITADQYQGLLERIVMSTLTTVPCFVFLFINGVMLFTLRSKAVFRETSRYVLLFNLLLADTLQMAMCQILYLLSTGRMTLTYTVCGLLLIVAILTNEISPLTLVVMCLERYVAVCYPLRHSTIITTRNTAVAVIVVWAVGSLHILARVILMLEFPFEELESLQMKDLCSDKMLFRGPKSDVYDKVHTCLLFVGAGVAVSCSYIGVMIAARSASTDKASIRKARKTLLLHLMQLGLSLSSTIFNPLLIHLSTILTRIEFVRMTNVLYVCIFLFPRCLSSLIYGIRDQTIRPVFMYHLCCRLKLSVVRAKAQVDFVK